MTRSLAFLFLIFFVGCAKQDPAPQQQSAQPSDTLLHAQSNVPVDQTTIVDSGNGLIIDRTHIRSEEHQKLLERFEPLDVATIYHDYKPLRTKKASESEVAAFLKKKKITKDELVAILDEGDRLGWGATK